MARVAILTYHPIHIVDNSYAGNDLLALEADLASFGRRDVRVRSLEQIFTPPGEDRLLAPLDGPTVAITFDDGSVFDFIDHPHPTCGPQRSAATILREATATSGARPLATTFVIASPAARSELDARDYFGGGYWPDDWWGDAVASGALAVESHSWDHNHPSLARSAQRDNVRGTFMNIETWGEAEAEVAQSVAYIASRAGRAPRFFAYPWGEANAFLAGEYFPRRGPELGLRAAVGSAPVASGYASEDSDRWNIPRFVCGHDWRDPAGLERILDGLEA
jgi:peptidoglycan/xylan/chitin deacetylase (PgdA/CDA1 family)